jgi:hypothetical protein
MMRVGGSGGRLMEGGQRPQSSLRHEVTKPAAPPTAGQPVVVKLQAKSCDV